MSVTLVENPTFPYLIEEQKREVTSYITVSAPRFIDNALLEAVLDRDPTLFYLPGASLVSRDRADGLSSHTIVLRHSFARDEENDRAYVARLELRGLQLIASWEGAMRYAAMLTEVLFYPDAAENPFIGAERKDDEATPYANAGYPYLPDPVAFYNDRGDRVLSLPMEVEITLNYGFIGDGLSARLVETMAHHAQARVERQAERDAALAAELAKRAAREAEHQAWLLTDEGRDETALRLVLDRIRLIAAGDALSDEALANLYTDGEQYAVSLTDEQVERFNRARSTGFVARKGLAKAADEGRMAFVEGFESGLTIR